MIPVSVRGLIAVLGLCAAASVAVVGLAPAQVDHGTTDTVLEIGRPLERELSGKDRSGFRLALQGGEYAHLTVEQDGIDVVVHVRDAGGNTVADFDAESTTVGTEAVGIVADTPTTYRVDVVPAYPRIGSGRYTIRLDEERTAGDLERNLFEAHRLQMQAAGLEAAGKYEVAQPLAVRALELAERAAGRDDAYVGYLTTRLAEIHRNRGDALAAERLFRQAIDVDGRALGRDHPQTAYALLRLSAFYNGRDDFTRAEPLAEEALAITERALGTGHPRVASCLIVVSLVHSRRENYDRAIPELQRALTIAERTFDPDDSTVLAILNNLGDIYALRKDFDRAEPLLLRAIEGLERTLGGDHIRVAVPLQNLGTIARERQQYARALELFGRAEAVRAKVLGPGHMQVATLLLNIGNVYNDLGDYASALANYQRALPVLEVAAGPYHTYTIDALGSLARRYAGDGDLVRAFEYQERLDRVLEKNTELNLAVGSERDKLAYFQSIRERVGDMIALQLRDRTDAAAADPARALDEKVLQPIRSLAGDATRLLISPDGDLNLVPFEALIDEAGHYAVERYSISYLSSGRDLLRMQVPRPANSETIVIADPDFGDPFRDHANAAAAPQPLAPAPVHRSVTTGPDVSTMYFAPLAGTADEARAIKSLFPEATLLLREQASKATLAHLNSPRILHIATHGFFLENADADADRRHGCRRPGAPLARGPSAEGSRHPGSSTPSCDPVSRSPAPI